MKYSPVIMVPKEMVSMESKGQLGAAPVASSLLSSQSIDLYYVFCVFPQPGRKIARGGIYNQF
jgi:hypothetical protein